MRNKLLFGKEKRKNELKKLHVRAWKLWSEIVRRKAIKKIGDCYVFECFTCGVRFLSWKELEAGHYKHNCLDFNELNIHAQCTHCNKFLHGNLGKYLSALQKKYGMDIDEKIEIARAIERKQKKGILYYLALIQDLKKQLELIKSE